MMTWLKSSCTAVLTLALIACATAGSGDDSEAGADAAANTPDARPPGTPDAPPPGAPDAPVVGTPDAPPVPQSITLSHSTSLAITPGNSVSCNLDNLHADNSYYRVFDLPSLGVTSPLEISKVTVGIETALAGVGTTQPATVRLHTLTGPLTLANLTLFGSVDIAVANQNETLLDVPIAATAPAGSTVVVEVFTPDGQPSGHSFFIGSNTAGATGPSYLAAVDCSAAEPADVAGLGFPDMHIVLTITGLHTP
jgi:hypothetical protein